MEISLLNNHGPCSFPTSRMWTNRPKDNDIHLVELASLTKKLFWSQNWQIDQEQLVMLSVDM